MNPSYVLEAVTTILAVATAVYVVIISIRRSRRVKKMEEEMKQTPSPSVPQEMDGRFQVLTSELPSGKPFNPKIIALEDELDVLYTKMEDTTLKLSERLHLYEREDELVGQMTALFIQEGDRRFYGEMRDTINSGSNPLMENNRDEGNQTQNR